MIGMVELYVRGFGMMYDDLLKGYWVVFYFGIGMVGFVVIVVVFFVRMLRVYKLSDVY